MSKKVNKVAVVGHFAFGKNLLNGQTIKTKIITEELVSRYGEDEVIKIDTHDIGRNIFFLPFILWKVLSSSCNVIILPAQNGVKLIAPLLILENIIWKRKLHYIVIGGWLPKFLKERRFLSFVLKNFNSIYVETSTMKRNLELQGFINIRIMFNFKRLDIIGESELPNIEDLPYKLCTFSRVMKEKGIEDAINAIKEINSQYNKIVYELDIYGQIEEKQKAWFEEIQHSFPSYINYLGEVPFDKSTAVLKKYFALVFPTKFYTEGIPGTIIDAYAAGIPIISAKWESFADMIEEDVTGIGYEFNDFNHLKEILCSIITNPNVINNMRKNCIEKAELFSPTNAMNVLFFEVDNEKDNVLYK